LAAFAIGLFPVRLVIPWTAVNFTAVSGARPQLKMTWRMSEFYLTAAIIVILALAVMFIISKIQE